MAQADEDLTLAELADRTGITERTIRYYIQFGLLPAPQGAGPKSRYGRAHLDRLTLIRRFQENHLPLNAIGKILAQRSEKEIERMAEGPEKASRSSALDYVQSLFGSEDSSSAALLKQPATPGHGERSYWQRIPLSPDIELHVRRPLSKPDNRRLEELLRRVRELFQEGSDR